MIQHLRNKTQGLLPSEAPTSSSPLGGFQNLVKDLDIKIDKTRKRDPSTKKRVSSLPR